MEDTKWKTGSLEQLTDEPSVELAKVEALRSIAQSLVQIQVNLKEVDRTLKGLHFKK